ncbi:GTP-binding protein [Desulfatibacillum aliphaticivorans]|uniref:GTP-binding protein n=1 Tax=Desulfatibacillum aliphaticivorans TaxID=218208 RepID=UPI00047FC5FA|nr:GTP-binding protein [Desulfatibacillum aliphaticivorans]
MSNNLVIFGPAHAGKSTLAGYLRVRLDSSFNFNKHVDSIKDEKWFTDDKALSSIVDTAKKERELRDTSSKLGTSRFIHSYGIENQNNSNKIYSNLTIIDTPGAQHKYKERIKGMYFGEIGVFVIEAKKVLNTTIDNIHEYYSPLMLWKKLEGKHRL